MMQEPDITVKCDHCGFEEKFNLTGSYLNRNKKTNVTEFNDSNVEDDMKSAGWAKIDGKDICSKCKELLGIIPK